ncbi:MAG: DUF4390 domain-containing protein [Desulfobulbaceae bacterium]|nr:DUF4390 domain-containing protein [Desulfobulbaceae bacterium]HIJ78736.1 DUF4390 domain-containing protein [Deltaproteobacteria bacterium]
MKNFLIKNLNLPRISLFLLLLGLSLYGQNALAKDAVIEELIVTNSKNDILLFMDVTNAFTKEMEEGVRNGMPVSFTFFVELYRNRSGWLDQDLVDLEFDHTLTYDILKEEYSVFRSEVKGQSFKTKSLAEAKTCMATLNGLAVAPLSILMPNEEYLLKVKAKLAEKKLPLYFHYVIPFLSLWDFETEWYSVKFRY